jgi:hypothetical protein
MTARGYNSDYEIDALLASSKHNIETMDNSGKERKMIEEDALPSSALEKKRGRKRADPTEKRQTTTKRTPGRPPKEKKWKEEEKKVKEKVQSNTWLGRRDVT